MPRIETIYACRECGSCYDNWKFANLCEESCKSIKEAKGCIKQAFGLFVENSPFVSEGD